MQGRHHVRLGQNELGRSNPRGGEMETFPSDNVRGSAHSLSPSAWHDDDYAREFSRSLRSGAVHGMWHLLLVRGRDRIGYLSFNQAPS